MNGGPDNLYLEIWKRVRTSETTALEFLRVKTNILEHIWGYQSFIEQSTQADPFGMTRQRSKGFGQLLLGELMALQGLRSSCWRTSRR